MKDQLISFETAKLAKQRGFNFYQPIQYSEGVNPTTQFNYSLEQCLLFKDVYYTPTQSLLQRWLREIHKQIITIEPHFYELAGIKYSFKVYVHSYHSHDYDTYERALEDALFHTLKQLK